MTLDEFIDHYYRFTTSSIDETGISPSPLHAVGADDKLIVAALMPDITPNQVYRIFWKMVTGYDKIKDPQAVILGIDRTTRPGQGTEFADVFTCICWYNDPKVNWKNSFKIGVVNYQHAPRIIRPWDWNNKFWINTMTVEATRFRP